MNNSFSFMWYAFKEVIVEYFEPVWTPEFWMGFCAGAFVVVGILK